MSHMKTRTEKFLELVRAEIEKLGELPNSEVFLTVAKAASNVLESDELHYQLREKIAGEFSSASYRYITKKWKELKEESND